MADEQKNPSPAYVSYLTLKNTIRGLMQNGHIPNRIDHSMLPGMSGSARAQFVVALRFFGLIDKSGVPSPKLRELAAANEAGWKTAMKSLVESAYPDQIKLLTTGTPQQLRESFGEIGGIVTPAVRFLLAAVKDAGISVSPHILKGAAGPKAPKKKKVADGTAAPASGQNSTEFKGANSQPTFAESLLAKFPNFDPTWSSEQQTSWFSAYERLLGFNSKEKKSAAPKEPRTE